MRLFMCIMQQRELDYINRLCDHKQQIIDHVLATLAKVLEKQGNEGHQVQSPPVQNEVVVTPPQSTFNVNLTNAFTPSQPSRRKLAQRNRRERELISGRSSKRTRRNLETDLQNIPVSMSSHIPVAQKSTLTRFSYLPMKPIYESSRSSWRAYHTSNITDITQIMDPKTGEEKPITYRLDDGDANFQEQENNSNNNMCAVAVESGDGGVCGACGKAGSSKRCSGCKAVMYCVKRGYRFVSSALILASSSHRQKCQELRKFGGLIAKSDVSSIGGKTSCCDGKSIKEFPLIKKVLFPCEEFVKLFEE
ncbi:hypothetical protein IFM89_006369 [Coptis chinensis]|uniref:Uncharacterized protein n=1 Tax=Coptis chinensis TaxID=261450 RepID=A0A835HUA6_9MAGN|nr:hypothetical protein IFM89_006369 [Coptis chinensis]